MSSGVFRGKESSNRIELSRLVQDILKFHCFGWVDEVWVGGVNPNACAYTHMHAYTHTHAHACIMNMIINANGLHLGIPYDVMCVHVYVLLYKD